MNQFKQFTTNKNLVHIIRHYSKNISKNNKWVSVIGLEIHAQIDSESKLFSGAPTDFTTPVNRNVSLFDCATPGTLPVLNKRCVEAGVLTALSLNCRINPVSMFDRKHYFYADLPAGYQITQQRAPLANDGYLKFHVYMNEGNKKPYVTKVRLKQLQLEQDSGKSLHADDRSLVDLNRAGTPLMELVFEPDLRTAEEAAGLVKELILIFQRLGTCSCKMEEGALRVDVNVSVNKKGDPLGTRSEIKNIGSVRGVAGAVDFEINRQIEVLESGGVVVNETRAWDAASKTTLPMRDKEQLQDYRYMPEPNLPPLHIAIGPVQQGCVNVDSLRARIPELPEETRNNLRDKFGLTNEQSIILVNEDSLLTIFKDASKHSDGVDKKLIANILINDLLAQIHKNKLRLDEVKMSGVLVKELASLVQEGAINKKTANLVINELLEGDTRNPTEIVTEKKWAQINDQEELERICRAVLDENPKVVKVYKSGKNKLFNALLGLTASKSENRANMAKCTAILKELLGK